MFFFFQIYFYASYIFKEAGISDDKIQYVTIGTGTCEFTACIMCVSIRHQGTCYVRQLYNRETVVCIPLKALTQTRD